MVISWLQPEAGTAITASLTDPDPDGDVVTKSPTWAWEVSEIGVNDLDIDNDDHWGDAPGTGGTTSASYTPELIRRSRRSRYLRVTATYTAMATKTVHAMSAYPVQAAGLGATNESPDFVRVIRSSEVWRRPLRWAMTSPVRLWPRWGPSDTDILTYGLRAVGANDLTYITGVTAEWDRPTDADDVAAFDIDKATGQITVAQEAGLREQRHCGTGMENTSWSPRSRTPAAWATPSWWSSRPKTGTKTRC